MESELDALEGPLPKSRTQIHAAIGLVRSFPEAARHQIRLWANEAENEREAVEYLRSIEQHISAVFQVIYDVLASAIEFADEGTLRRLIDTECEALQIAPRSVILCAARPGRIHTDTRSLYDTVFGPFDLEIDHRREKEPEAPFLLMSIPRYEALHARWIPWILGHELAHVKIERDGLDAHVNQIQPEVFEEWRRMTPPRWLGDVQNITAAISVVWDEWVREVLCDAYAVHRFGPAALLATADFHEAIGGYSRISKSHPPGHLRAEFMGVWLEHRDVPALSPMVAAFVQEPPPAADDVIASLGGMLRERSAMLFEVAAGMAPTPRFDRSNDIAAELLRGVPGVPLGPRAPNDDDLPSVGEIANAAWIAQSEAMDLTHQDVPPIDRLANHALTILDLAHRWRRAGGELERLESDEGNTTTDDNRGGTLSRPGLAERLLREEDPLLVVPMFASALGNASIDVRLGNKFVVFQRSAAPGFAPLDQKDDPRLMQVPVSRDWAEKVVLHPGELLLGATLEYLVIPNDTAAQVITRSSYGRLGVITATAVQVQPGFRGCLTLELVNLGEVPLEIQPGERIAQLVFSTVTHSSKSVSKYDCPIGPEFSKVREDDDAAVLRRLSAT
jgi:deoxycytidine triphosphate deaminase